MPVNSLLGQRQILIEVIADPLYAYSLADTYAACSQIPGGGVTLKLPPDPQPADSYAWGDCDNSCGPGSPIIVTPAGGNTIAGLASLIITTPGATGVAVFDPATNNWFVFASGGGGGGGGNASALVGTYAIAAGLVPVATVVKLSAADTAAEAQADAAAHAGIGVVSQIVHPTVAEVTYAGECGGFVGLVPGNVYYLDPAVAGGVTNVAPVAVGQIVQRVGFAKDATTMVVQMAGGGFAQL